MTSHATFLLRLPCDTHVFVLGVFELRSSCLHVVEVMGSEVRHFKLSQRDGGPPPPQGEASHGAVGGSSHAVILFERPQDLSPSGGQPARGGQRGRSVVNLCLRLLTSCPCAHAATTHTSSAMNTPCALSIANSVQISSVSGRIHPKRGVSCCLAWFARPEERHQCQ